MKLKILAVLVIMAALGGFWWKESSAPPVEAEKPVKIVRTVPSAPVKMEDLPAPPASSQPVEGDDLALIQRIRAALASVNPDDRQLVFSKLLPALVRDNPTMAAQLADSLDKGSLRDDAMLCVARSWTVLDRQAAENWATQLPDSNDRDAMLTSVCFQVAEKDPRQAVIMAAQHNLENLPGSVMENLTQQWAARDFSGALSWIGEFPAGEQRDNMYARLALVQAQTSPMAAAQMVVQQIPPGPIQDEAAMSVVNQWATRDLAGATAWVKQFPPGPLRERAERELSGIAAYQQKN